MKTTSVVLIQDIVTSNAGAWLIIATLRFFSLAEQCQTQNFYLRCFKSDFDAVKSKFGLLIEWIEKTTSIRRWPKYEDNLQLKNPDLEDRTRPELTQP